MHRNEFERIDHFISFLVQILLKKAEDHIRKEQKLYEPIYCDIVKLSGHSKSCIIGVSENVIAGDKEHDQVKNAFPCGVLLDHELVKHHKIIPCHVCTNVLIIFNDFIVLSGAQSLLLESLALVYITLFVEVTDLLLQEVKSVKNSLLPVQFQLTLIESFFAVLY